MVKKYFYHGFFTEIHGIKEEVLSEVISSSLSSVMRQGDFLFSGSAQFLCLFGVCRGI
ncbi:hypothetical protein JXL19_08510 [bacterium]|nr:hypothetical protein [bacterium]